MPTALRPCGGRLSAVVAAVTLLSLLVAAPAGAEPSAPNTVTAHGAAGHHGPTGGMQLHRDLVGMAPTESGDGYWLVAGDGGIFSFGDAEFHGSTGDISLNQPIVGMAAHPDGGGYWFVAADGGVFSFGDAEFAGSLGDQRLAAPVRGMAATADGDGYWLTGQDGQVWAFGARHHGDAVASDQQVALTVGIAAHPDDSGYWLVHGPPPRQPVASFTTPLEPGQDRNHNIHLGADYINGSLIRPGARFSLNDAIGPRTRERGFREDGFIEGGEVGTAVGGGVSQLATTFVNAAWFAGIEIVEFRQHSIYFERYPMCREGTLAGDILDVVVVNDSPYDITVRTGYTNSSVTITLVSRPWARVSSWIGEPYNVEGPDGAFSVDCRRTITYPAERTRSEQYSWRYDSGYPG